MGSRVPGVIRRFIDRVCVDDGDMEQFDVSQCARFGTTSASHVGNVTND